ncbi:MAG: diacylglycerol kinase family protein [Candidatus Zixiibacteriota bacterium]
MKIKCIINEASGRGRNRDLIARLKAKFVGHEVDYVRTARAGHAVEIASHAVEDRFDIIVAVGGDGTINEVINGVVPSPIPVGIIPTGTANDLAEYMKIPADVEKACDIILRGNTCAIDSICVNGWHFITVGGLGLPADAVKNATLCTNKLRFLRRLLKVVGNRIYVLGLIVAFIRSIGRSNSTRISCNCYSLNHKIHSLIVANQPALGRRFRVCPEAVNNDGYFDLFLIEDGRGLREYARAVAGTISARHVNMPNVRMHRTSMATIVTDRRLCFFGDGNIGCEGSNFDISIHPKAVRLLTP